ncbi:MAG: hypothetical protein A2622_08590 [Bdellovibrionales bacterium RIFCSPHIGHO2_01_FULL_40_29]|nr:MAG: hypothetical protein A2622_08590 [Bdellovibrionales bacterium RIFCSPHIGHO2_01_FULL_40_29]OFZ35546.1 MAG: hypothetical protein A3D17_07825 [Bdellovibrionales bacterium RIFCSPHIGHO2_02_FULL_40_15]
MQILIGYYAALQSVVEIGLGSFLHALHIPFTGHALSLNQGLILTLATRRTEGRREAVIVVNGTALVTSLFKSFSPIGKRLTPMLAISIQGFLFSIGVFIFGPTLLGVLLGISLLALWSFAQPLLLAYLFFGERLFAAIEKLWIEIAEKLSIPIDYGVGILMGFIIVKIILALIIAFLGWKFHHVVIEKYFDKISEYKEKIGFKLPKRIQVSPSRGAFKDLFNPWMLVSLILTVGFMALNQHSPAQEIFIYVMRVMATAWLCFWILRAFPQRWVEFFLNRFPALKKIVDHVLAEVGQRR